MNLEIQSRRSERAQPSCAYCHDPVTDEGHNCPSCQTILHQDCQAELGRCPTLGCDEARRTAPSHLYAGNPTAFLGLAPNPARESDISIFRPFSDLIIKLSQIVIFLIFSVSFILVLFLLILTMIQSFEIAPRYSELTFLTVSSFVLWRITQRFYRVIRNQRQS
jgi:hypothetical protein